MEPVYRTEQTTYSTTSPVETATIRFRPEYIRSVPGILKILECILSLIVMICTMVEPWAGGRGWVQFVAIHALITTLIYLFIHLFNLNQRFRVTWWLLILFVYYLVHTVFYLIAAIVAAVNGRFDSAAAAAFFCFVALGVYGFDTYLQYKTWRFPESAGNTDPMTVTHQTTTTTTTTVMTNQPDSCGVEDESFRPPPPYSKY